MNKEQHEPSEAQKIVDDKRARAEAKAAAAANAPAMRPLTPEETRFVDGWCKGMRGIDQAMLIFNISKAVERLLAESEQRRQNKAGIVGPDGSKL